MVRKNKGETMALPTRTSVDDVRQLCAFLAKKPTGASVGEARGVLGEKAVDVRKLHALKQWGFIEDQDHLRLTARGRDVVREAGAHSKAAFTDAIRSIPPYAAIIERAGHRKEATMTATDVAVHWHDYFRAASSSSDEILNDQAIAFFQVAEAAGLGEMVVGRRGNPTRFSFGAVQLQAYLDGAIELPAESHSESLGSTDTLTPRDEVETRGDGDRSQHAAALGQAIFIGHGKNKKPVEQLKRILDQFKIPYKVAIEEPSLGRPIGSKVREVMQGCNCAVLIFTADEELRDKDGDPVWRPSENVSHELGAAAYLYENRIVIMKEDDVSLPTNFREIGYISFAKDQLDAKAMDILRELIGFGIVKVTT
jgi:hypothetical protein